MSEQLITREALLVVSRDVILLHRRRMAVYAVEIRPDQVTPTVVLYLQDEDGRTCFELYAPDDRVTVVLPKPAPRHLRLEAARPRSVWRHVCGAEFEALGMYAEPCPKCGLTGSWTEAKAVATCAS